MTNYCTAAEVRAQIDKTGTGDDTEITAIIEAVSREIDNLCNRPDGFVAAATATARVFTAHKEGGYVWVDECTEVTQVATRQTVGGTYTTIASSQYLAFAGSPDRPNYNKTPYVGVVMMDNTLLPFDANKPLVKVTAKWGYAAVVPATIKQACIMQTARLFQRGTSGFADAMGDERTGMLLFRKKLDGDIQTMLTRYRRIAI